MFGGKRYVIFEPRFKLHLTKFDIDPLIRLNLNEKNKI